MIEGYYDIYDTNYNLLNTITAYARVAITRTNGAYTAQVTFDTDDTDYGIGDSKTDDALYNPTAFARLVSGTVDLDL